MEVALYDINKWGCVLGWMSLDAVPYLITTWWRHQMETFSAWLAICAENSPVPVNSPHKGQWRGALMFSLICACISAWVNNRQAGDLRRHCGHDDVTVMNWPRTTTRKTESINFTWIMIYMIIYFVWIIMFDARHKHGVGKTDFKILNCLCGSL